MTDRYDGKPPVEEAARGCICTWGEYYDYREFNGESVPVVVYEPFDNPDCPLHGQREKKEGER